MKVKLAHQSTRTPASDDDAATKKYVLDNKGQGDILFRWNRTDISEFLLVDPLVQGWTLSFVPQAGPVPGHLKLQAPPSWTNATGPVYVLITPDLSSLDHDMVITHDFIDPTLYTQTVGAMDRYIGTADHVMAVWDIEPGEAPEQRVVLVESGTPTALYTNPEVLPDFDNGDIVRTHSTCCKGMFGCGWGRITGHGIYAGSLVALYTDPTAGFVFSSLSRAGSFGNETLRIFDIVVKKPSGGS